MTVLIIEGPDLSGKTTAIEKIAKYFNSGFILKNAMRPKKKEDSKKLYEHYRYLLGLVFDSPQNVIILDRFFPSQAVYSYLRGEDEFDSINIQNLDYFCAQRNFVYVYLDTPTETLLKRYDERGDEHIKRTDLIKIKTRYDWFYKRTSMKKLKIDTTKEEWLKELVEFLEG